MLDLQAEDRRNRKKCWITVTMQTSFSTEIITGATSTVR